MLRNQLRPAIVITLALCVITGIIYPGAVTAVAQLLFPRQANGSLIRGADGAPIGSALIGQQFARPEYFHPRPSAAGAGYDDTLSAGSNLGPTSAKLDSLVAARVDTVVAQDGGVKGKIPSDMVTASGSGLDPDISPADAFLQVERVARARHADSAAVRALVDRHVQGRQFGLFGEPRVHVLELNLDLDRSFPLHAAASHDR
ncbi:MAG: potassium-transporting ATPase subunit KdpC [Gemmatimonadaceae bacterium]|nr:potassium-transporting ATPase subunit KdpC [Gemmatimonadaceae bacterium]